MITEKLQKVLARIGLGSRREIEQWIQAGQIQINRHPATLGQRVNGTEEIRVKGRKIDFETVNNRIPQRVLCYHKPVGEVCTRHDPEERSTVFSRLPQLAAGRWISVGRLDVTTEGLLLFTTDGELAHRLMHPSYTLEREYAVRVLGEVDEAVLRRLQTGVLLEDGLASFQEIVEAGGDGANHWYRVTVSEGRNRVVRRLWESQGITVSRLLRTRFGPVLLPTSLRRGHFCDLEPNVELVLRQRVNLNVPKPVRNDKVTRHKR
ncbi:MAG: 23S rRNA pseudouridylate synthase B [Beggiatoa sp. IS2]|nr:MAG: 23S rRNA pseudouridylate synthase B [Beggiatoa sp. IS2]